MKEIFVHFFKVKGVNDDAYLDDCHFVPSMDSLAEWIRMAYARDCFWVKERFFYDVETPKEEVTIEEYQTEEGQEKYWNCHLTKLINAQENGELLKKAIENSYKSIGDHFVFFIFEIGGKDVFVSVDSSLEKKDIKALELEDVTNEYKTKFFEAINQKEIDDFVDTHNQDEIEKRYATKWIKDNNETNSMWEW